MSTTRITDRAHIKPLIAKCDQTTQMVKEFLQSPLKDHTEIMYLAHSAVKKGENVDVKIGKTTLRAALTRRTGCERTYKKEYKFYIRGRDKNDPLRGAERKVFDRLPDEELEQLIIDFERRNKSSKTKYCIEDYVEEPHEEWDTLYLATHRFGDQEYECFPVIEGGFAFPYKYDEKTHKYIRASHWEKLVQKVLEPFRNDWRLTTTESEVVKLTSSPDVLLSETAETRTVGIQNSSDDSERCTLSYEKYQIYINLFKMTCLELGGIPFDFTKDYAFRHQIADPLKNDPSWYDDFAAEQTKCFWEGIKAHMDK